MFLKTIGKIGLSTYIAMTTGYETTLFGKQKIFRFRKEQGRSKYKLILGDAAISITGKKLISLLYSKFIGEDINDIPVLKNVGISACPANAPVYVKKYTNLDLTKNGGQGVFREFVEKILIENNLLDTALERYFKSLESFRQ
jgi:hypothetical protein